MPALRITKYIEGEHELLRVAVSGPFFGLSATVDTRAHEDASADVEFVFEVSVDGRRWTRNGGMRGIGAGRLHTCSFRSDKHVYGGKQQDGHRYLEAYIPIVPEVAFVRAVAVVRKGSLVCDAIDLVVDTEQKEVPTGVRRSIGVVNTATAAANTEAITTGSITSTTGSLFVACTGSSAGPALTDSNSNTYSTAATGAGIAQFYSANATGGAGHTFTLTDTGDFNPKQLGVLEVDDATTTGFDAASTIGSDFGTSHPTNAVTTSDTGNRLLVAMWRDTGFAVAITGPGTPWTTRVSLNSGQFIVSTRADSGATSYTATATSTQTQTDNMIAAYVEAAAGAGNVKTVNNLAFASVKVINTLAIASVKTINGVTTT